MNRVSTASKDRNEERAEQSQRRKQPTVEDYLSESSGGSMSTIPERKVNFAPQMLPPAPTSRSVPGADEDLQRQFPQAMEVTAQTMSNAREGDSRAFVIAPKGQMGQLRRSDSSKIDSTMDRREKRATEGGTLAVTLSDQGASSDSSNGKPNWNRKRGNLDHQRDRPPRLSRDVKPFDGLHRRLHPQTIPVTRAGYANSTMVPYGYPMNGTPWRDQNHALAPPMHPAALHPVPADVYAKNLRSAYPWVTNPPLDFPHQPPSLLPPPISTSYDSLYRSSYPWVPDQPLEFPPQPPSLLPPPTSAKNDSLLNSLEKLLLAKEEQDKRQLEDAKFCRLESLLLNLNEAHSKADEVEANAVIVMNEEAVDPIELVETYLATIRKAKEKEFLEAHRVLTWIDGRKTSKVPTSNKPNVADYLVLDESSEISESEDAPTEVSSFSSASMPAPTEVSSFSSASMPAPTEEALARRRVRFQKQLMLRDGIEVSTSSSTPSLSFGDTDSTKSSTQPYRTPPVAKSVPSDDHSDAVEVSCTTDTLSSNHSLTADTTEDKASTEIDALLRYVHDHEPQLVRKSISNETSYLEAICARVRRQFRRRPPPGTQRLEWTCECGEELFADLPVTNPAQYEQVLAFLSSPYSTARPSGQNSSKPLDLEAGTADFIDSSPTSNQDGSRAGNGKASTFRSGSSSTLVGFRHSQNSNDQSGASYARSKYLELCVNVGKYETKLAEIQVTSNSITGATFCDDAQLFQKIYVHYHALRKQTWRRLFFRPAGVRFVHFGVQTEARVIFFAADPLPTKKVIAAKEWEFNMQPPFPPPIDSRTFLHFFWKHSKHSHPKSFKFVDRLPKKLGESLVSSIGIHETREGWGMHIVERANKAVICWTLFVVVLVSFGVSVGYSLLSKQMDSGFGIGQWMVAALLPMLTAVFFSLEDDVLTVWD